MLYRQGVTRQVLPDVIKKVENNTTAFRTTLLKRDKERIKKLRNYNDDASKDKVLMSVLAIISITISPPIGNNLIIQD